MKTLLKLAFLFPLFKKTIVAAVVHNPIGMNVVYPDNIPDFTEWANYINESSKGVVIERGSLTNQDNGQWRKEIKL